jgi:hypothetical protein
MLSPDEEKDAYQWAGNGIYSEISEAGIQTGYKSQAYAFCEDLHVSDFSHRIWRVAFLVVADVSRIPQGTGATSELWERRTSM